MRKPIVGISCTQVLYETAGDQFFGTAVYGAQEYYVKAVIEAGGIPVLLPMTSDSEAVADMVAAIDALILTGGQDIDPLLYGEVPHQNLGSLLHERDTFDTTLVRLATDAGIPVLGICRGCQIINVAFGGTLYQDLPSQCEGVHNHCLLASPKKPGHYVDIDSASFLAPIYGECAAVNTLHHQAVKDVAPDFFVGAKAKDGVIESIQHKDKFILGVQWHPEWLSRLDSKALQVFELLINTAKK